MKLLLKYLVFYCAVFLLGCSDIDGQMSKKTPGQIIRKTASVTPGLKKLGTGPRYWMAYEYCWMHNKAIPEELWKNNIDWVHKNLKDFGYDMVSNDGWIEAAQTIDENGYIFKYNDSWKNGFKYWANYLAERGMKHGIYYNPMWLTKTAYKENSPVKGTSYTAREITGVTPFNSELHWVDVGKPGAKEWIQGYVRYFKDMGVNYLRIDFLENYENNYGREKYETALQWIREAADTTMFLSLVMPNCFDHGEMELKYGDMIRISDDCFDGGWDFVSDRRRGIHKKNWPQYANAFDGFVSFADIGGRDQMILDGDFIRLNTLKNADEKMAQISLYVMAGSPITVADQFNSIGDNLKFYQNRELLELNDIGFVGKPISYDLNDTVNSSRWIGQLPNGDWVIGLFNREDSYEVRRIDFQKELGLDGNSSYKGRDLWKHKEIGNIKKEYTIKLDPHSCKIIRISNDTQKYEAEVASLIKGAKRNNSIQNFSSIGYVEIPDSENSSVLFAIEVPIKGEYKFQLKYQNSSPLIATTSISVNGQIMKDKVELPSSNEWNKTDFTTYLEEGINYLKIIKTSKDKGAYNLDYIQLIL